MLDIPGSAFEPYELGDAMDPEGHAARHGVTCRTCGLNWPCPDRNRLDTYHAPTRIPTGATVTTYEDLDRLVTWAPDLNLPVVLDRDHTSWLLYCDEDGDGCAGTVPCPDDGIPARCNLEDLPTRGPLFVLFNGDPTTVSYRADAAAEER